MTSNETHNNLLKLQACFKPESFKAFKKKEYEVTVSTPGIGTHVHNYLEDSHYETTNERPIVIRGTASEEWVIDFNKLQKTYTNLNGSELGITDITKQPLKIKTKPDANQIWACKIPKNIQVDVNTSWGDVLKANRDGVMHGSGDYIVCADKDGKPNFNDTWVVNGKIFPNTYIENI